MTDRRPLVEEGLPAPVYFVQFRRPGDGNWHRCTQTHGGKYEARQQYKRFTASHPDYTVRLVQLAHTVVTPEGPETR